MRQVYEDAAQRLGRSGQLEAGARLREIRDRRIRKGRKDWQGNPKSTIALIEPPTMTIVFRAAAAFSDCAACRT